MEPKTMGATTFGKRIWAHKATNERLGRLEDRQEELLRKLDGPARHGRRWRRLFSLSVLALVGVSAIAVGVITSSTTTFSSAKSDVFVYNESLLGIVSQGMDTTASAVAAAGASQGAAIEMAVSFGAANTALSAGDWFYQVDVKEASNTSVTSGTYKVELFVDGTSKGALYITQASADSSASVEGVTLKWSLGASLSANSAYVVKASAV